MTRQTNTDTKRSTRRSLIHARQWSDLYCLWRLCGKHACRRSHACKGDTRACFRALPLVPPEALLFMKGFDEGHDEGLSFDEMLERNEEEWAALKDWQELVMSTLPESNVWSESS